jgi:hypothetical protein
LFLGDMPMIRQLLPKTSKRLLIHSNIKYLAHDPPFYCNESISAKFKVLENTPRIVHLIFPESPAELSEAELEQLAAGAIPEPLPRWSMFSRFGTIPISIP